MQDALKARSMRLSQLSCDSALSAAALDRLRERYGEWPVPTKAVESTVAHAAVVPGTPDEDSIDHIRGEAPFTAADLTSAHTLVSHDGPSHGHESLPYSPTATVDLPAAAADAVPESDGHTVLTSSSEAAATPMPLASASEVVRPVWTRDAVGESDTVATFSQRQSAAPPPAGVDGKCPAVLRARGEEAITAFLKCVGAAAGWEQIRPLKAQDGILVRGRDVAQSKARQFHVSASFYGVRADVVLRSLNTERMAWDKALATNPVYLARYSVADVDATEIDVVGYSTSPAAGGMISGRSFVDMRVNRRALCTAPAEQAASPAADLYELTSAICHAVAEGQTEAQAAAAKWLVTAGREKLIRGTNLSALAANSNLHANWCEPTDWDLSSLSASL